MIEDIKSHRRAKTMAAKTIDQDSVSEQTQPSTTQKKQASAPILENSESTKQVAKKKLNLKTWLKRLNRKQAIIMSVSLGLLISSGVVFALTRPEPPAPEPPAPVVKEEPPKPPEPIVSKLTGLDVTKKEQSLPVTSVMIENSPDARPQSGLAQAGVVFEAIAEGGITRFVCFYQESQPDYIGPVRSVRPYYLDFIVPFDAPIAHAGGSGQALAEIRTQNIKDLDYAFNPNSYERVSTRFAPHNLYTSRAKLLELQKQKGFTSSKFTSFLRKKDKPAATITASRVDLDISSYLYDVSFTYDKKTNSYKRIMGGAPHVDERSGTQISPKVVIVPVMPHSYAGIYSVYKNIGKDKVYIFQDGTVQEGTWKKGSRAEQITFLDKKGKKIPLNAGQTWITLVGNASEVAVSK